MKPRENPIKGKRRRLAIFHHKSAYRRGIARARPRHGWLIRYRSRITGKWAAYDRRRVLRVEYFVYKKTVATPGQLARAARLERIKDKVLARAPLTSQERKIAVRAKDWIHARPPLLAEARRLAAEFMKDSDVPHQVLEKSPMAYKWLYRPFRYIYDVTEMAGGNGVVFYILIAVEVKDSDFSDAHVDFLVIRQTILLDGPRTPEQQARKWHMFDDLGRDYAQQKGHLWTSELISPQIANVQYVGTLAFTLYKYVPRAVDLRTGKRIKRIKRRKR